MRIVTLLSRDRMLVAYWSIPTVVADNLKITIVAFWGRPFFAYALVTLPVVVMTPRDFAEFAFW